MVAESEPPDDGGLVIGRRPRGSSHRRLVRLAEVTEDSRDALGVLHERDELHAPSALGALLDVERERARQELVPEKTRLWRSPESTLEVASEARAIDADFVVDPAPLAMGLAHTDSNQHVNSLVYARLFEEAVLRRLATMGRSRDTLARAFDIAYRRPSFAGDVLHVRLRLWDYANGLIATGSFFAEGKDDRARVFVHMRLEGQ